MNFNSIHNNIGNKPNIIGKKFTSNKTKPPSKNELTDDDELTANNKIILSNFNNTNNKGNTDPIYIYVDQLLKHYNNNNINLFNSNYIKFNKLITDNNKYKYNRFTNYIIKLVNIMNTLFNSNIDFKNQIKNYESMPSILFMPYIIAPKLKIKTKASIKLVYLQYLILFNINETNGLFIDSNLKIAQSVLKANNNKLKY